MSRHDLKARKIQVEVIERRDTTPLTPIEVRNPMIGTQEYDTSDQFAFIQRKDLNGIGVDSVSLWDGTPINQNRYVTHMIGTIEYMFRSEIDLNDSEPTLSNPDWQLIGGVAGSNESHGIFTTTDTGQATVVIPHGLGAIPSYFNPVAANPGAINLSRVNLNADATNIIITPAFTQNDGATLRYTWEAKI